ncbi:MAG: hypothetical protein ACLRIS_10715 [Flavonifractor plautii]
MNILILTGKFGMGHWSASQSLRQQPAAGVPGAEVEVLDFVAEAMPTPPRPCISASICW